MFLSIAIAAYFLVAAVFFVLTYIEGWNRRDGWDAYRVLGLALCSVWPLLVAYIYVFDKEAGAENLSHGSPKAH